MLSIASRAPRGPHRLSLRDGVEPGGPHRASLRAGMEVGARLEDYYGLAQRPFGVTLDQAFVYPSRSYSTVLEEVRRGVEQREGLVVVTGEPGTGKTMLCRTLLQGWCEQLEAPVHVSMVLDPHVTFDDLLLHVLTDFGVTRARGPAPLGAGGETDPRALALRAAAAAPTRHQLVRALQQFLVSLIPAGTCAVVVIDEAQHVDRGVLEQLRLLLNLETNEAKLLQIVLVGDSSLTRILRRPEMRQLDQRVARRCVLEALGPTEVKPYVEHRLATAQRLAQVLDIDALERGDAVVQLAPRLVAFTSSAVRAVAAASHGVPRVVNLVCDRALEIGHERRTHTIDAHIVRAAAQRVAARSAGKPRRRIPSAAAAAAGVALVATGIGTWRSIAYREAALPSPPAAFAAALPVLATAPMDVRRLEVFDSFNVRAASFKGQVAAADLAAKLTAAGLPAWVRSTRPHPSTVARGALSKVEGQGPGLRPQQESGPTTLRPGARSLGPPFHVIVGPYLLQSEAAAARDIVARYGHSDADVFVEPAPSEGQTAKAVGPGDAFGSGGLR